MTDITLSEMPPQPGAWHTDPSGRFASRWWNGHEWTENVRDRNGNIALDSTGSVTTTGNGFAPGGFSQAPPNPSFNMVADGAWAAAPQQVLVANVSKSPGIAIASVVLGVGAFFFALIPMFGFLSVPFAVTGLALGGGGLMRAKNGYEGKELSWAGIGANAAALLVSLLWLLFVVVGVGTA